MVDNLIDVIASLTLIMREETEQLKAHARNGTLAELAAAKLRLVGVLESELARIERSEADWIGTVDDARREKLLATLFALGDASSANAAALERQIDLSVELIGAIATEAKRIAGRSTTTYGKGGDLSSFDPTAPISVNSQY